MTPNQHGPDWASDDGSVRLWCGDCRDVLPMLKVDAVVTDPPYGIGEHGGACRTRGRPGYSKHENKGWDKERPSRSVFASIMECSRDQIIWGGNYFADLLPPSMGWLYWRKLMGGDFSDGELAWTSRKAALREFVRCPKGMDKAHPCEKPVDLMEWCLGFLASANTVLDPFMGSGTTAIACLRTGRKFMGIEIDPHYFDVAVKRIEAELSRAPLFDQPPPRQHQLFEAGHDG